jgi:hypothetical protein
MSWGGKVYNDVRFADQDRFYDQEFGKPHPQELDTSGYARSRTTHFKDTFERDDGSEGYLYSEPNHPQRSKTAVLPLSANQSKRNLSPSKSKEEKKKKEKKEPVEGKDLGPDVKRDLVKAAELKLGTKLNLWKSLYEFWKNHIKERPAKPAEFSVSISKPPRPTSAEKKPVSEKAAPTPKNKKVLELQVIYDKYKDCRAADIRTTLKNIDEKEQRNKEIVEEEKKILMKKAKEQQKEQAIKQEIEDYFKRYIDKKI